MSDITAVSVSFWTINDDKDEEERVDVFIEHQNGTIHAKGSFGEGEKWDEEEDGGKLTGPFTLNLTPQVPAAESGKLKIRVHKEPHGSATGAGWSMAVGVQGRVSDGSDAVLLARTDEARMGDGNPIDRTWNFQSIGSVAALTQSAQSPEFSVQLTSPEILAKAKKRYFDELVGQGFTKDQALKIVTSD
jgi:hypothetical protein